MSRIPLIGACVVCWDEESDRWAVDLRYSNGAHLAYEVGSKEQAQQKVRDLLSRRKLTMVGHQSA